MTNSITTTLYRLSLSFLFIGNLYAADVSQTYQSDDIDDFSGGLNTVVAPHKLDPKFSPNEKNLFVHRKPGSLISRNGFVQVGSTNTLVDGRFGFIYNKTDGSKKFIVSDGSRVLSTADFVNYVLVSSAMNNTVSLDCAQVEDKVWCSNGSDNVFTWNDSVKTILDGTNGTPNVPKFRYIEYQGGRVWGLNTTSEKASLDFSSVVSTDAVLISPDDSRAWPSVNRLYIGRGDGEEGTALWIQNGRLYIGKERSIWTILGNTPTSFVPDKVETQVGVTSNDSIVLNDGFANLKSMNGVYEFDGSRARRISDAISPDIANINDATNKTLTNLWDSQSDFARGNFVRQSTATSLGLLTGYAGDIYLNTACGTPAQNCATTPSTSSFLVLGSGTDTGFIVLKPTFTLNSNYAGLVNYIDLHTVLDTGGDSNITVTIKNARTGLTQAVTNPMGAGSAFTRWDYFYVGNPGARVEFTGDDVNQSNVQIKVARGVGANNFSVEVPTNTGLSNVFLEHTTTMSYLSDITTMTTVVSWNTFDSLNETNGGQLNFYVRSGNSIANVVTQTFKPIVPGSRIGESVSNNFIQWASTMVAASTATAFPTVDTVEISHIEGSSNRDRPFGIEWNREYWLSIATATNNFSLQYVRAWRTNPNPDAWNRMQGMDIRSFFKDGNSTLYAGSASTGVFYRLDYGTNDNGKPIESWWDTIELQGKDQFLDKKLFEVWVDIEKETGGIFTLGVSTNSAPFYYATTSIDGTGDTARFFKGLGGTGKNSYRFRLLNNQLDVPFTFHTFRWYYEPTQVRSTP